MLDIKQLNSLRIYYLLIVLIITLTPNILSSLIINDMDFSKYLCLSLLVLSSVIVLIIRYITKRVNVFSYSSLDLVLALWFCYILLNFYYHGVSNSIRIEEIYILCMYYILLRNIKIKDYNFVFVAVIGSGIIQCILGNLQLWGYLPSYHVNFKMTGSFMNPGPFAGFLSIIFSIVFVFYIFQFQLIEIKTKIFSCKKYYKLFYGFILFLILSVLLPSASRASWFSIIVSIIYAFIVHKNFNFYNNRIRKIVVGGFLFVGILLALAFINLSSVNGRFLIWKISLSTIKDNLMLGTGIGGFRRIYMNRQAEYFMNNANPDEAMVADDVTYCFNEYIQYLMENGLIGLFLLILAYILILKIKDKTTLYYAAISGLLSLSVFACFSYPMHILSIKILSVSLLAYLASISEQKYFHLNALKKHLYAILLKVCFY